MRLHHLEATAFGPFADTIRVDFDDLSSAGLFLLTGPTGAGKTSVLDAVCFALYGDVPGDRALAKRLRSDHAPAHRGPSVTLECTLGTRRFRILRSPAWQRPKRRGTGTTTEQARVVLTERVHGDWRPVTTRLDEAGHLLGELLGMTLAQFTQVAMLPQGEFQAFLRARADDRQKLLEKLFRTERFRQVEGWLAERRRELTREVHQREQDVRILLSRVGEAVDATPPEVAEQPAEQLAATVLDWLAERAEQLELRSRAATSDLETARPRAEASRSALSEGQELSRRRARWHDADRRRQALEARDDEVARARETVDAARRAAPLTGLMEVADSAAESHAQARMEAQRTREVALVRLEPGVDDLVRARADADRTAARAQALLPLETELAELFEQTQQADARHRELERSLATTEADLAALPAECAEAERAVADCREAAGLAPAAQDAVQQALARYDGARLEVRLATELHEASELSRGRRDELQGHRDTLLQLREERLTGMAAEIAGALVVGGECPVCGSCEHPSPAPSRAQAPDGAAERAAQSRVDTSEAAYFAAQQHERELATRLAVAREQAGGRDGATAEAQLDLARTEQRRLAALADSLPDRERRRDRLSTRLESARERAANLRSGLETLRAAHTQGRERAATIRDRLRDALAGSRATSLTELVDEARTASELCGAAVECAQAEQRTAEAAEAAAARLDRSRERAGFVDLAALRAAARAAEEVADLERRIREHDDARTAVRVVLEDPDLATAVGADEPDVDALARAAEEDRARLSRAEQASATLARHRERLDALTAEVETVVAGWRPARDELDLVTSLAAFTEGKSPDNRLSMRLSAYALSFRLRQVVDAANERLLRMSDQRYLLEHSLGRGAGDRRGGLALLVRDAWSGESRDPATLSGGETFLVALALALGLSDVVTHEAAGAELGTLFVDEGFGSLDPQTLDHVLDTLETLRTGGRVVGVVSHVSEVGERIPARLVVSKSPGGSTVRTVTTDV